MKVGIAGNLKGKVKTSDQGDNELPGQMRKDLIKRQNGAPCNFVWLFARGGEIADIYQEIQKGLVKEPALLRQLGIDEIKDLSDEEIVEAVEELIETLEKIEFIEISDYTKVADQ